jgi:hypothetical protein
MTTYTIKVPHGVTERVNLHAHSGESITLSEDAIQQFLKENPELTAEVHNNALKMVEDTMPKTGENGTVSYAYKLDVINNIQKLKI